MISTLTKKEKHDKHRKKELGKSITVWKEKFAASHNGVEPTQGDIEEDESMRDVFHEYVALQQELKKEKKNSASDPKERLKTILDDIEQFKKMWKTQFGSDPSEQDLQGDATISSKMKEAEQLMLSVSSQAVSPSKGAEASPNNNNNNNNVVTKTQTADSAAASSQTANFAQYSQRSNVEDEFTGQQQQQQTNDDGNNRSQRLREAFGASFRRKSTAGMNSYNNSTTKNNDDDDDYF